MLNNDQKLQMCHRDCHLGNIMFRYDDHRDPEQHTHKNAVFGDLGMVCIKFPREERRIDLFLFFSPMNTPRTLQRSFSCKWFDHRQLAAAFLYNVVLLNKVRFFSQEKLAHIVKALGIQDISSVSKNTWLQTYVKPVTADEQRELATLFNKLLVTEVQGPSQQVSITASHLSASPRVSRSP